MQSELLPCKVSYSHLTVSIVLRTASVSEGGGDSDDDLGEDEYKIESIVASKKEGRKIFYLIKRLGYPESENSWEPAANIPKHNEVLKEYMESVK